MEPAQMNATKQVMGQYQKTHAELKKAEQNIKSGVPVGRHLKNSSQAFVENLTSLAGASKRMAAKLKELESGNVKGEAGEEGLKINYFEILTERMKNELGGIIKSCSKVLKLPSKGRMGSQSSDIGQKAWDSIGMQVKSIGQKIINESQVGNSDQYVTIAKLMDLKEVLYSQMFEALLYKKTLLYEDLDLNHNVATKETNVVYMSEKVVQIYEKLQDFKAEKGCLPSKIDYVPVTEDSEGPFSNFGIGEGDDSNQGETESSKWLLALTEAYVDFEDLVRKNWLSRDKIKDLMDDNPVQRDLRHQVEELVERCNDLKKKNVQLNAEAHQKEDRANGMTESLQRQQKLEERVVELEHKTETQEKQIKSLQSKVAELQMKVKKAEAKEQAYKTKYMPRLYETRKHVEDLAVELEKIREDASLLPSMFQAEAADKKKINTEKDIAVRNAESKAKMHGKLVKQIEDLTSERDRKKQLAIQAIAARSSVKEHLDRATDKIAELEKQLGIYKKSLSEAEQEKSDAINKHDEMFNSVSSLNQRIEELEQHKLHLLEKLKGYGDKGGLEYIVKTQKLEDVQSREFDTRVVVEDYDPMKSRQEADEQYDQNIAAQKKSIGRAKQK